MFSRMKEAARLATLEKAVRKYLSTENLLDGASVRLTPTEGGDIRATVVLAETARLSEEAQSDLRGGLEGIDGLGTVTLVATKHRDKPGAGQSGGLQQSENVASAHDNPLALPGARRRADTAKIRPGDAKHIIAVASGKGGVGKSTVAAQLALTLASRGHAVGLLDLDIYGPSVPLLFGKEGEKPSLSDGKIVPIGAASSLTIMSIGFLVDEEKAVAWRGPMVMGASKQLLGDVAWPQLDYLVIDTPPGTGDAHLTLLQKTEIDGTLIVTTPSPLAMADVRRGATLFTKMKAPLLGIVENMATLPDGSRPFGPPLEAAKLEALGLTKHFEVPLVPGAVTPPLEAAFDAMAPVADYVETQYPT